MVFVDTIKRFTVYEQLCVIYHRVSAYQRQFDDALPTFALSALYDFYRERGRFTSANNESCNVITDSRASIKSRFRIRTFLYVSALIVNYHASVHVDLEIGDCRNRRNFLLAVTSAVPITSP